MRSTTRLRRARGGRAADSDARRARTDMLERPGPAAAGSGGSSVRWSAIAVLGRQISQLLAALVLARVLGPDHYGVISAATIYVTLTTLVLDQGMAAALVQRPVISRALPGAVATANLLTAVVLAAT